MKIDANKQLQLVDYFGAPNANWLFRRDLDVNVTPVLFDYAAASSSSARARSAGSGCSTATALGGEDHRTTLHTTPLLCNDAQAFDGHGIWGALSAWQDPHGAQWVLAPFWGPVSKKFKAPIEHAAPRAAASPRTSWRSSAGKWQLTPAWLSRDMDLAEEAVIANGIVFAYCGGRRRHAGRADAPGTSRAGRRYGGGLSSGPGAPLPESRKAALYALDAQTGKELWSSGNTSSPGITSAA